MARTSAAIRRQAVKTTADGEALVAAARAYIGVPFRHAGRSMQGVDCIGLLLCAAHDAGVTTYDETHYGTAVDTDRLRRQIEEVCALVWSPVDTDDPRDEAQPGDVLLFQVMASPQHTGMFTGEGFVHAYQGVGYVVETPLEGRWLRRVVAVYRWVGGP